VADFGDADALESIMLRIFTLLYSFFHVFSLSYKLLFLFITTFLSIDSIFKVFYKVLGEKLCSACLIPYLILLSGNLVSHMITGEQPYFIFHRHELGCFLVPWFGIYI
jgi:uncharacterized membrane protein